MLSNYKNLIILFLSLFIAASMYVMQMRLDSSKQQFHACQANINLQNNAIYQLQKTMQARVAKQKDAEIKAMQVAGRYQERIDKMMSAPAPKDCGGAVQWAIREGRKMK